MAVDSADRRAPVRHAIRRPRHRALASALGLVAAVSGFTLVLVEASLHYATAGTTTYDIGELLPQVTPEPTPATEGLTDASAGEALDLLLLGSDTRSGASNQELGKGDVDGMRSDAAMILHLSADRQRVDIVAIPRDSLVRISDCRMFDGTVRSGWTDTFNAAFSSGGVNGNVGEAAACVITTVYDLTGIMVDHWAVIDMAGFRDMVDAIDGVPMCIPTDVHDEHSHADFTAGPQVLDGEEALAWVRTRKSLGDGTDLMRIERQQELLTHMARKVLGLDLLTEPTTATRFVNAVARSLTMNEQLADGHYLVGLAWSLRNLDTANIYMTTVPWHWSPDGEGDVIWTEPDAQAVFDALQADESVKELLEPEEPDTAATATAEPSADATETSEPATSPSPKRETEKQILADCVIEQ